jgi:threonine synthase
MQQFAETGQLAFSAAQIAEVNEIFLATAVDNEQTLATIRAFHNEAGYVLDPHTATGVKAGKDLSGGEYPVICLATAHPAKFSEAVNQAIGQDPERPASLHGLEEREKRCEIIAAETGKIKDYLREHALS